VLTTNTVFDRIVETTFASPTLVAKVVDSINDLAVLLDDLSPVFIDALKIERNFIENTRASSHHAEYSHYCSLR